MGERIESVWEAVEICMINSFINTQRYHHEQHLVAILLQLHATLRNHILMIKHTSAEHANHC